MLLVVSESIPPLTADESLHEYVEDGSTHLSIRDPRRILWYIPLMPHPDRLTTYHLSRREMATLDIHVSYACRGDDDHVTRCCYHP